MLFVSSYFFAQRRMVKLVEQKSKLLGECFPHFGAQSGVILVRSLREA